MSKDPAFLFYSSDFLVGTEIMTDEECGIYIRLLCIQHQHQGVIAKSYFLQRTAKHPAVADKFVEEESGFYNSVLRGHIAKRAAFTESRRSNRSSKPQDEHMNNISSSYVEHMSNTSKTLVRHMENENENVIVLSHKDKDKNIEANGSFLEQHLLEQWGQREGRLNALRMQELVTHAKKHGWAKVFEVIEQAGRRNACNVAYVTACLEPKSKQSEHDRVRAELIQREKDREAKKNGNG
jgi:hypothetical protein